jgi:hypothetical protein
MRAGSFSRTPSWSLWQKRRWTGLFYQVARDIKELALEVSRISDYRKKHTLPQLHELLEWGKKSVIGRLYCRSLNSLMLLATCTNFSLACRTLGN